MVSVVLGDAQDAVDAVPVVLGGGGVGDHGYCAAPAARRATGVVVLDGVFRLFGSLIPYDPKTQK